MRLLKQVPECPLHHWLGGLRSFANTPRAIRVFASTSRNRTLPRGWRALRVAFEQAVEECRGAGIQASDF